MKYIRTENNIYLIHKDISYGGNKIYKIYNHDFSIIGNDFKVADTLKELCDEFVYKKQGNEIPQRCHLTYFGAWYSNDDLMYLTDEEISTIRGGIWTDKGFIYVTKMNKGNLVLI